MKIRLLYILSFLLIAFNVFAFMPSGNGSDPELTNALYKSGIKIVDIRTRPEWRQTGIVKGSYPITFFDEKGNYDVKEFLKKLDKVVTPAEHFALICRSGNRTTTVSKLLKKIGYINVVNLKGGVIAASRNGITFVKYNR